jgi:hypothetical protein
MEEAGKENGSFIKVLGKRSIIKAFGYRAFVKILMGISRSCIVPTL